MTFQAQTTWSYNVEALTKWPTFFADDIFKSMVWISIKFPMKFVQWTTKQHIDSGDGLVPKWRRAINPDSKVHGAYMGPTWGQQDPCGPHVGPMNLAIRVTAIAISAVCSLTYSPNLEAFNIQTIGSFLYVIYFLWVFHSSYIFAMKLVQ